MRVNAHGTAQVAGAAAESGATFLHVSTDYVFDGTAAAPIAPDARPHPLGAYGASKAAGETAVRDAGGDWMILRTGWLYGPGAGTSWTPCAARPSRGTRSVSWTTSTGRRHRCGCSRKSPGRCSRARARGILHVAAAGRASWYDVARAVYEALGREPGLVTPGASAQLGRRARRPAYAVLDCRETERALGAALPGWREQLEPYVRLGTMAAAAWARWRREGGRARRADWGRGLHPMTRVTNKHLLPVYDRPMIFYPLQTLVDAGISEILLVTGGGNAGDFLRLLGNGHEFGLRHLHYTYQEGEGGIADALGLAEDFAEGEPICVILGDNLLQRSIRPHVERYGRSGAMILLKEVPDLPVFEGSRITTIEEKPAAPRSQFAVIGVYFYDARVFEIIRGLSPSERGELEISDVNNRYLAWGELTHEVIDGWWTDAGTVESLYRAATLVAAERQAGR